MLALSLPKIRLKTNSGAGKMAGRLLKKKYVKYRAQARDSNPSILSLVIMAMEMGEDIRRSINVVGKLGRI